MRAVAGRLVGSLIPLLLCGGTLASPPPVEVPLELWTGPGYPSGLPVGGTMGVSWGDYDADGYIDLFACFSGLLWRNVEGVTWEFAGNLGDFIPPAERRYGASFADYDNDGLPDIATAPRVPAWGDNRMHLLRNLGGGPHFIDVASDPAIVDVQPYNNAETLCWADYNGDGSLDLFVPVYPAWEGGPGNFFLSGLGPTGPGGAHRFTEASGPAGLDNPPGTARPEGAQAADVDFDGDVDLFSNGTLYQNVSTQDATRFNAMSEISSGIGLRSSKDEGTVFLDYDMDGDEDLLVAYALDGVRIWENQGDGTFLAAEAGIVDSPLTGLNLGMSAADWDNDGDVDFTTRQVFRRNMWIEEGRRHFTVATHSIPAAHLSSATPAWGDWDKDGDQDCAVGNWGSDGHFYLNTLYTSSTPEEARRHLRVRVVRDSPAVPRGLEVEFGAAAEVRVRNGTDAFRRRMFVASSHGYLNQNEYALHFALPPDPAPTDPSSDVRFDLSVDFPGLPAQGLWRVDARVNPVLADLDLATLADREITVHRCGTVVVDGVARDPIPLASPTLVTTTRGLSQPGAEALPPLSTVSGPDSYVGLAFDTMGATDRLSLEEILLDGRLDSPAGCQPDPFNIALWDVTDRSSPLLVSGGAVTRVTSSRNRRSILPASMVLEPGRSYRLVAKVTDYRLTPIAAPVASGPVTVLGAISYQDSSPCTGRRAARTSVDGTWTALAFRFRPIPSSVAVDPVGSSLRIDRGADQSLLFRWQDASAAGYEILRCDAAAGPCKPSFHDSTRIPSYLEPPPSGSGRENAWVRVRAVNECTLGVRSNESSGGE